MNCAVALGALLAVIAPVGHHPAGGLHRGRDDAATRADRSDAPAGHPDVLVVSSVSNTDPAQQLARAAAAPSRPGVPIPTAVSGRFVAPVSGTLTSAFGSRWGAMHTGLDIANEIGTPVLAVADGTVIDSGPADGFGLWVRIAHDDGSVSVYGHIDQALAVVGQRVRAGEQIATVGNRGISTGPHLHFEIADPSGAKVDPTSWLGERGVILSETVRD